MIEHLNVKLSDIQNQKIEMEVDEEENIQAQIDELWVKEEKFWR